MEETGREKRCSGLAMELNEWRNVVEIYKAMEEEKKAKSTKPQKEFAKANHMQDNLSKKYGNKKTINSPVVTTRIGDIHSDDDRH